MEVELEVLQALKRANAAGEMLDVADLTSFCSVSGEFSMTSRWRDILRATRLLRKLGEIMTTVWNISQATAELRNTTSFLHITAPPRRFGRAYSSDEDGDGPGDLSIQLIEVLLIDQLEDLFFAEDLAHFCSTFRAFIDSQRLHEVRWGVTVDGHTFAAEETRLYLERTHGAVSYTHLTLPTNREV